MRFIDTNIFIRFIAGDDAAKTVACRALFERVELGDEEVVAGEANIAEVAYVLASPKLYRLSHAEIRDRLAALIRLPGLKLPSKRMYLQALDIYAEHPSLDFEDALTVARMERSKLTELLSYDRDFDRLPQFRSADGLTRTEP